MSSAATRRRPGAYGYQRRSTSSCQIEIYTLRDGVFVLALAVDAAQHVVSPTLTGLSFAASRLFAA
jgi:hypothetical protein